MKKYLISLDKDEHRRERFFTQPNTQDFKVFSAINTMNSELSELSEKFDINQFEQHYHRHVTKGEIGCTLSHLSVYQQIIDDEDIAEQDYVLICEDDAQFNQAFQQNLDKLLNQNPNADILLVGQSKIAEFNDIELEINYPTTFNFLLQRSEDCRFAICYPYKNYFAGTVAYLIKKSAARLILEKVKQHNKAYWLADDFILLGDQFHLDIQIVRPLMVIENPSLNSNLQSVRGSEANNLLKKMLKYPLKKILAVKRNLGRL